MKRSHLSASISRYQHHWPTGRPIIRQCGPICNSDLAFSLNVVCFFERFAKCFCERMTCIQIKRHLAGIVKLRSYCCFLDCGTSDRTKKTVIESCFLFSCFFFKCTSSSIFLKFWSKWMNCCSFIQTSSRQTIHSAHVHTYIYIFKDRRMYGWTDAHGSSTKEINHKLNV